MQFLGFHKSAHQLPDSRSVFPADPVSYYVRHTAWLLLSANLCINLAIKEWEIITENSISV